MNSKNLSHSAQQVYRRDRDRFYLSLFAPADKREALLAVYALNSELLGVHDAIHEEMMGHIRYAWWQETLEGLYAGKPRQGHPVLEALEPVIGQGVDVLPLVEAYRGAFPLLPLPLRERVGERGVSDEEVTPHLTSPSRGEELISIDAILETISLQLLSPSPLVGEGWGEGGVSE